MVFKSFHFRNEAVFSRNCVLTLAAGMAFGFCSAYVLLSIVDSGKSEVVSPCSGCSGSDRNETLTGDSQLVSELSQKVRVLCWVMTRPTDINVKRCQSVKRTWGKRCNLLLFVSSEADPDLPAVGLDVQEGRDFLWGKTKKAFEYIYENYLDEFDWFMKADDDTYVVVDNLRYMLQSHNPDDPVYFGRKFVKYIELGYMSGGSGYVLSREALRRFVERSLPDPEKCRTGDSGNEDIEMGQCLASVDVVAGSSTDCKGRGRFFPLELESHLTPGRLEGNNWFWEYANTASFEKDTDCCSETAISFHYVSPETMEVYDSFIHHIRPYGIITRLVKAKYPNYC